jgi:4,5-dihydroxyphthalate decarboxylase
MSKLTLSIALNPYEHALDLLTGRVVAEGIDLNWLHVPVAGVGDRFVKGREFDVAEVCLVEYVARLVSGDRSLVAIPVFPSRMFVQSALWVREGTSITDAVEWLCSGRRGATDDQTASTYLRLWLGHETKRDVEPWPLIDSHTLTAKLSTGEIEVGLTFARPAKAVRLMPHAIELERDYYKTSGIFPIQSVICLHRDLVERHRWLSRSLFDGFMRAKKDSLQRLITAGMSRYPMPWINAYIVRTRAVFGDDFWPYGIEANRLTLEAFLNATGKNITVEELFDGSLRA